MALPAGALTATVTVGASVGIAGTAGVVSDFTVAPEYRLVWGATGDAVDTFAEDGTAGSIVILADQPGVFASSTVNGAAALVEVRGWPLVARWRVTSGGDSRWHTRRFAAPAAGTTVDVDMLPQDGAADLGVGAQYVTQGIPGAWWESVAELSTRAYHLLRALPADAQPWCAEMYVTQLTAIRDGYTPTIAPSMGMVWADGPASGWETAGYFHDAGVVTPRPEAFHKGSHQSWPREIPPVDPVQAAHRYVEHIRATEAAWPELVALFP